ncbi:hypothetical protein HCW_05840 [Helicobacter cetorum MIT 00-7128]|uniref:Outer membrane protein HofE n=2 Tax=Helicobacter cetorum TaxID=138563 RepID=I0ENB1_HELC0|nr:hypothetical protein HCW_05840 [Helicobacter cetorum MIT 00-7128]
MLVSQRMLALIAPFCCMQAYLQAFDYKFSGIAESFSKVGFNHSKLNSKEGIFPTETFVTTTIKLQADANLLPKKIENHSIKIGIGGILGGVAYDSTKTLIDQSNGKVYGSEIYVYMGRWYGYLGNAPWKHSRIEANAHARNYVLYNAYLFYTYKDKFTMKLGRYLSKAMFMSGYTQGFEFNYKINSKVALNWFSSFGRALAVGEWIRDWYAPIVTEYGDKVSNTGIHAAQINFYSKYVKVTPFIYFSPKTYEAPGINFHFDSNPKFKGLGLRSQTTINVIFPLCASNLSDIYWRNAKIGKWSSSLLIHQRFDYNEYNFGFGYYQNFGNANAKIGWYGSPIPIGFRNNSVYGGVLNNMISPNAITGYLFGGGVHKKFLWGILSKYTYSPRASEWGVNLNLGYNWSATFTTDIKLTYHVVDTHEGYRVGYDGNPSLCNHNGYSCKANIQDRSHLMTSMKFFF